MNNLRRILEKVVASERSAPTQPVGLRYVLAPTEAAVELYAIGAGLKRREVVHVLAGEAEGLRGRRLRPEQVVYLKGAHNHPCFGEAVSELRRMGLELPNPVDPAESVWVDGPREGTHAP